MNIEADVVIPSMGRPHAKICEAYLDCIPFPHNVIWSTEGKTWPEAVNMGIKKTSGNRDVVLMDDDIFLMPSTFMGLMDFYDKADIFGFKLLFPDGKIQHAGGVFSGADGGLVGHRFFMQEDKGQAEYPCYLGHVTTSLIYIKRHVLEKIGGMATDYPGTQMEDVDFCLRAVQSGFKILYLPFPAVHLESATKKDMPKFRIGMAMNLIELRRRYFGGGDLLKKMMDFPKPYANRS